MGFSIQPPPTISASVNSTQLVLGTAASITPVALVASSQQTIIPADAAATNGRLIDGITNTSSTAIVYVAHGRAATTSNYDYILYPNSSVNDKKLGVELVSAIATANTTICATYRSLVEV